MLLRRVVMAVVFCGLVGVAAYAEDAAPAPVKLVKGDKVLFLGDSITQFGGGQDGYVTLVKTALDAQLKDLGIEVINAGISGNRVPDLQARLDGDVIAKKPTVVVIYIGINDVWHSTSGNGTPKDAYEKGLKEIIGKIKAIGARVVLCTPSVIGEKTGGANPLDKMLDEYSDISRTVAKDTGVQLLDLRQAFVDCLKGLNQKNTDREVLTGDGVHLNAAGNRFVAGKMLEALGVGPATK